MEGRVPGLGLGLGQVGYLCLGAGFCWDNLPGLGAGAGGRVREGLLWVDSGHGSQWSNSILDCYAWLSVLLPVWLIFVAKHCPH